jgi:hypothetical protein
MYGLKRVYYAAFTTYNASDIYIVDLQETLVTEEDYINYSVNGRYFGSSLLSSGPQIASSGTSRNIKSTFGTYSIFFDEDLSIRSEDTSNIDWSIMKVSKTEFLKDCLKHFLKEKYSDELFSLFILKFGF